MAQHKPSASLALDVFPDGIDLAAVDDPTPAQVARAAWNEIRRWMDDGYEPVVDVTMPDGTIHAVDLEKN